MGCINIVFSLYHSYMYTSVTPHTRCRLKVLKLERILDFLKMEEELIQNMERLRPQEQKEEVAIF